MTSPPLYHVTRNTGQYGPGRMDWLLVRADGVLIEHCGLSYDLHADARRLNRAVEDAERAIFVSPSSLERATDRLAHDVSRIYDVLP